MAAILKCKNNNKQEELMGNKRIVGRWRYGKAFCKVSRT
jgi:hypothetical protein